jgi:hypothetical protein
MREMMTATARGTIAAGGGMRLRRPMAAPARARPSSRETSCRRWEGLSGHKGLVCPPMRGTMQRTGRWTGRRHRLDCPAYLGLALYACFLIIIYKKKNLHPSSSRDWMEWGGREEKASSSRAGTCYWCPSVVVEQPKQLGPFATSRTPTTTPWRSRHSHPGTSQAHLS